MACLISYGAVAHIKGTGGQYSAAPPHYDFPAAAAGRSPWPPRVHFRIEKKSKKQARVTQAGTKCAAGTIDSYQKQHSIRQSSLSRFDTLRRTLGDKIWLLAGGERLTEDTAARAKQLLTTAAAGKQWHDSVRNGCVRK